MHTKRHVRRSKCLLPPEGLQKHMEAMLGCGTYLELYDQERPCASAIRDSADGLYRIAGGSDWRSTGGRVSMSSNVWMSTSSTVSVRSNQNDLSCQTCRNMGR